MTDEKTNFPAMTLLELSIKYNVCRTTFKSWLKPFEAEIGERIGRIYTPKQIKIIIEKLGEP
jgi:hypothetical protein